MIIVRNRVLVIPVNERNIGTGFDINSDIRQIQISRYQTGGVDLSELDFYIDVTLPDKNKDTAMLKKEVQTEYIVLTWEISQRQVSKVGTVFVTVKAMNREATVRWATNRAAFYVGEIDSPPSAEGNALTVLQQAIQNFVNIKNKVESLVEKIPQKVEDELQRAIAKLDTKYNDAIRTIRTAFEDIARTEHTLSEQRKTEFAKLKEDFNTAMLHAQTVLDQKIEQADNLLKGIVQQGTKAIDDIKVAAAEQRQRFEQAIQGSKEKRDNNAN